MTMKQQHPKHNKIDVALLLEGSYPFVVGGVSAWVHRLIEESPQLNFAIIFLGSRPQDYTEGIRYELPKNVVRFEIHYLFSDDKSRIQSAFDADMISSSFEGFYLLNDLLKNKEKTKTKDFRDLNFYIECDHHKDFESFFHTKRSWRFIVNNYAHYCTDPSFNNYFWTSYSLQKPLWKIANIAKNFVRVGVLHPVSTGYAGFLGSILQRRYNFPMLLTEHGIYTKERRIELMQAKIWGEADLTQRFSTEMSYFRGLWMRYFEVLSRICYEASDPIISLFEGARAKQIEEGADEERTRIIPNGVDVEKYAAYRAERNITDKPILCLVGRVVPIKDVKTFIRAMKMISKEIPGAEAWIVGPADENPKYYEECVNLISVLDLEKNVLIKAGHQDVALIYPKVSLLVLTSISEGMPLVLLEGFAAGIPAISTSVGNCDELIYGCNEEDKKLGAAGVIVPLADPSAFAKAALDLLTHPDRWQNAQKAAIERVTKYYNQQLIFKRYQDMYEEKLKG